MKRVKSYKRILVVYKIKTQVYIREFESTDLALKRIKIILEQGGEVLCVWGE